MTLQYARAKTTRRSLVPLHMMHRLESAEKLHGMQRIVAFVSTLAVSDLATYAYWPGVRAGADFTQWPI